MHDWLTALIAFTETYRGDLYSVGSALVWSCSLILYKKATHQFSSFHINVYKNGIMIAVMLLLAMMLNDPFPAYNLQEWGLVTLSSILGIIIGDLLMIAALRRLGASLSAIMDCFYSPSIIVIAYLLYGETLSPLTYVGGLFVLMAVFVGSYDMRTSVKGKTLLIGLAFGATTHVSQGFGILMVKNMMQIHSLLWLSIIRFTIAEASLLVYAALSGKGLQKKEALVPLKSHLMVWGGALFGSAAVILWKAGFKWTLAGRAAIYNQLGTVFTILLAAVFLSEKLTPGRILATILGISGALIVGLSQ